MTVDEWWDEFKRAHNPRLDELSEYCARSAHEVFREYYLTPEGMMELQAEYTRRTKRARHG